MIIYKTEWVEEEIPDKFICDRCKKEVVDDMELQETYSISFMGGYASVFGDESEVSCDLCQQCLKELIGDFCVYDWEFLNMHWFTKDWWRYLLEKPKQDSSYIRSFWCRVKGHPDGVWWFNNSGELEPDMHCKNCGDDLG